MGTYGNIVDKIIWKNKKVKIKEIIEWSKNPRKLTKKQFEDIQKSINKFGIADPLIVNLDGKLIGGHQRKRILLESGFLKPEDDVDVRIPNRQLNTKEVEELAIRLNKNSGDWDWDILANEFKQEDLSDWGFEDWEFGEIKEEAVAAEIERDEYNNNISKIETDIVKGDIFELGKHRILCGDSTLIDDIKKLMQDKKSILIHADPPYGMGKEKDGVANDNLYREKLDIFQMQWWMSFRAFLEDNASAYIWGNAEDLWRLWYKGGLKDSEKLTFRNEIVWNKKNGQGMESEHHRMYPTASERCLFFILGEQGYNDNADNYWEGWEKIRDYLLKSRLEMGWDVPTMKKIVGHSDLSGDHWTSKSQFNFPTRDVYNKMKAEADKQREKKENNAFKKEYDDLKKEYDALKKEFYEIRAYFNNTHDCMNDVWDFEKVTGEERHNHATPKPVSMIARIIKSSSKEKSIVIEPFIGSGTTLVACEQTNRICYGMELEPKYVQVTIDRWEKLTGKKAKRIEVNNG